MKNDLLLCEFHDSRVETLRFDFPDRLVIVFQSFNCFYKTIQNGIADVWICRTTLSFSRVAKVDFSLLAAKTYVSDAVFDFKAPDCCDKYNLQLLEGKECISMKMVFGSGATVNVFGGFVRLEINERVCFLEKFDWIG